MLDAGDVILTLALWLHSLAAAAWVGGSLFYLIVLIPSLRRVPDVPRALASALRVEFSALVATSVIVLVATGAILAFERLTEVGGPYAVTLGAKVALSLWMFALARERRGQSQMIQAIHGQPASPTSLWGRAASALTGYNMLVILGLAVFFLSDLLGALYSLELRAR